MRLLNYTCSSGSVVLSFDTQFYHIKLSKWESNSNANAEMMYDCMELTFSKAKNQVSLFVDPSCKVLTFHVSQIDRADVQYGHILFLVEETLQGGEAWALGMAKLLKDGYDSQAPQTVKPSGVELCGIKSENIFACIARKNGSH